MKKMLINATRTEEIRVALLDGQRLYDLQIESEYQKKKKSNIYKSKVVRIENSLEAAFVEYDSLGRHGFLPFREVAPDNKSTDNSTGAPLSQGDEILVQVEKEERGNKGAGLSNYLSLAGRYLVLMPNNASGGGVSRRTSGAEKQDAREILNSLPVPSGMSVILRTASVGQSRESLQRDLDYLLGLWEEIQNEAFQPAPQLIYRDSDVTVRILRDYLSNEVSEILVDDPAFYEQAKSLLQRLMPEAVDRFMLYTESEPLFVRYHIESQIEEIYNRIVTLPSGGQMIFDNTEALMTIDINSARATSGADIEETALSTNLEAAKELARQLRLRNIGGLIVVDFIDMTLFNNQRKVEDCLRNETQSDYARVQIGRLSRFGLLEMSRQRLRPSMSEAHQSPCPRCEGTGQLHTLEAQVHLILRSMEEEAMKSQTDQVLALLPVQIASLIMNEKRAWINEIEQRSGAGLLLFPSSTMQTPAFRIRRIGRSERHLVDNVLQKEKEPDPAEAAYNQYRGHKKEAAVPAQVVSYSNQRTGSKRPIRRGSRSASIWDAIKSWFGSADQAPKLAARPKAGGRRRRRRRGASNNGQLGYNDSGPQSGRRDAQTDAGKRRSPSPGSLVKPGKGGTHQWHKSRGQRPQPTRHSD